MPNNAQESSLSSSSHYIPILTEQHVGNGISKARIKRRKKRSTQDMRMIPIDTSSDSSVSNEALKLSRNRRQLRTTKYNKVKRTVIDSDQFTSLELNCGTSSVSGNLFSKKDKVIAKRVCTRGGMTWANNPLLRGTKSTKLRPKLNTVFITSDNKSFLKTSSSDYSACSSHQYDSIGDSSSCDETETRDRNRNVGEGLRNYVNELSKENGNSFREESKGDYWHNIFKDDDKDNFPINGSKTQKSNCCYSYVPVTGTSYMKGNFDHNSYKNIHLDHPVHDIKTSAFCSYLQEKPLLSTEEKTSGSDINTKRSVCQYFKNRKLQGITTPETLICEVGKSLDLSSEYTSSMRGDERITSGWKNIEGQIGSSVVKNHSSLGSKVNLPKNFKNLPLTASSRGQNKIKIVLDSRRATEHSQIVSERSSSDKCLELGNSRKSLTSSNMTNPRINLVAPSLRNIQKSLYPSVNKTFDRLVQNVSNDEGEITINKRPNVTLMKDQNPCATSIMVGSENFSSYVTKSQTLVRKPKTSSMLNCFTESILWKVLFNKKEEWPASSLSKSSSSDTISSEASNVTSPKMLDLRTDVSKLQDQNKSPILTKNKVDGSKVGEITATTSALHTRVTNSFNRPQRSRSFSSFSDSVLRNTSANRTYFPINKKIYFQSCAQKQTDVNMSTDRLTSEKEVLQLNINSDYGFGSTSSFSTNVWDKLQIANSFRRASSEAISTGLSARYSPRGKRSVRSAFRNHYLLSSPRDLLGDDVIELKPSTANEMLNSSNAGRLDREYQHRFLDNNVDKCLIRLSQISRTSIDDLNSMEGIKDSVNVSKRHRRGGNYQQFMQRQHSESLDRRVNTFLKKYEGANKNRLKEGIPNNDDPQSVYDMSIDSLETNSHTKMTSENGVTNLERQKLNEDVNTGMLDSIKESLAMPSTSLEFECLSYMKIGCSSGSQIANTKDSQTTIEGSELHKTEGHRESEILNTEECVASFTTTGEQLADDAICDKTLATSEELNASIQKQTKIDSDTFQIPSTSSLRFGWLSRKNKRHISSEEKDDEYDIDTSLNNNNTELEKEIQENIDSYLSNGDVESKIKLDEVLIPEPDKILKTYEELDFQYYINLTNETDKMELQSQYSRMNNNFVSTLSLNTTTSRMSSCRNTESEEFSDGSASSSFTREDKFGALSKPEVAVQAGQDNEATTCASAKSGWIQENDNVFYMVHDTNDESNQACSLLESESPRTEIATSLISLDTMCNESEIDSKYAIMHKQAVENTLSIKSIQLDLLEVKSLWETTSYVSDSSFDFQGIEDMSDIPVVSDKKYVKEELLHGIQCTLDDSTEKSMKSVHGKFCHAGNAKDKSINTLSCAKEKTLIHENTICQNQFQERGSNKCVKCQRIKTTYRHVATSTSKTCTKHVLDESESSPAKVPLNHNNPTTCHLLLHQEKGFSTTSNKYLDSLDLCTSGNKINVCQELVNELKVCPTCQGIQNARSSELKSDVHLLSPANESITSTKADKKSSVFRRLIKSICFFAKREPDSDTESYSGESTTHVTSEGYWSDPIDATRDSIESSWDESARTTFRTPSGHCMKKSKSISFCDEEVDLGQMLH